MTIGNSTVESSASVSYFYLPLFALKNIAIIILTSWCRVKRWWRLHCWHHIISWPLLYLSLIHIYWIFCLGESQKTAYVSIFRKSTVASFSSCFSVRTCFSNRYHAFKPCLSNFCRTVESLHFNIGVGQFPLKITT